ncbi:LuxR family two component transcriptional regulator [Nocardioides albertanoniae]|uniref:LuxR family two component transcriptional regulator n=1 Tax=Nocardioides albertanoniae TaxID=1175486 RepID=A0A543A6I3_9ACTN|nr:response regulator [Nocardioides albertanoniae]TQL68211.1 LuxR family two component transcriptional regulator [Nocardioides albertanoniae]
MTSFEPSVVVADESPLLRAGLTALLARGGYQVVADACDSDQLLQAVTDTMPSVVVTDGRLGAGNIDEGITAAIRVHEKVPEMGIIVLGESVATTYAARVFASTGTGGLAYLRKSRVRATPHFLDVLGRVASGEVVVDPQVIDRMKTVKHDAEAMAALTLREREVMAMLGTGYPERAIISSLFANKRQFQLCLGEMLVKLGLPAGVEHRRAPTPLTHLRP